MTVPSPGAAVDGRVVAEWWRGLRGGRDSHEKSGGEDRASLAALRRCGSVTDAFVIPAFHALLRRAGIRSEQDQRVIRLAIAAIVAAHVREDAPGMSVARQLGPSQPDADDAVMSELRFRRLLQTPSNDELIRAMVRAVRLLKHRTNIEDLAGSILQWHRDGTRRRWAFQYFNAPDALPEPARPTDGAAVAETA